MCYRVLLSILMLAGLGACGDPVTGTSPDDTSPPADTLSDVPTEDDAKNPDAGQEDAGQKDASQLDAGQEDSPGVADTKDTAPMIDAEICLCPPSQHCDENDECAPDVCAQGVTTCADSATQKVCNEDGSGFDVNPCPDSEDCYLGECFVPLCDPAEPATCEDGSLKTCNSVGTQYVLTPCPGGHACQDGECVSIEPNVILILDTSGSMNALADGTDAKNCVGDGCPPWSWPDACDDPNAPATRLGKAKVALQSVINQAAGVRVALQRFPQNMNLLLGGQFNCNNGGLLGLSTWTADEHATHEIAAEKILGPSLALIMPVPFSGDGASTTQEILSWIDFAEIYESNEKTCNLLPIGCPTAEGQPACLDGYCANQKEPELRAVGESPIGRSLFYAGEFLRHRVVVEGRVCVEDADCLSPHYSCEEGVCRDPFRSCRPNVIVIFTDGGETVDTWPELKESSAAFFHPRIQAKRLHYGLGCASDADCMNGATCVDGVCAPADYAGPDQVCHLTNIACQKNQECKDYKYPCGPAQTCSGECEETGLTFTDTKAGQEVVRDPEGTPISATIHVVNASENINGTSLVAALGGGQYVPVDFADLGGLVDAFLPLLDIKLGAGACP